MDPGEWYKIKEEVYYWDGSWRDIYVLETVQEDWSNWIDLVNQNYSVQFYNGQSGQTEVAIDKKAVFEYQDKKSVLAHSAAIKLASIAVNCRFFFQDVIENDLDPRDIKTVEEHQELMDYLKAMSKKLGKPVVLTAENQPDLVYIIVEKDEVKININ
jgi:hypothetical protein